MVAHLHRHLVLQPRCCRVARCPLQKWYRRYFCSANWRKQLRWIRQHDRKWRSDLLAYRPKLCIQNSDTQLVLPLGQLSSGGNLLADGALVLNRLLADDLAPGERACLTLTQGKPWLCRMPIAAALNAPSILAQLHRKHEPLVLLTPGVLHHDADERLILAPLRHTRRHLREGKLQRHIDLRRSRGYTQQQPQQYRCRALAINGSRTRCTCGTYPLSSPQVRSRGYTEGAETRVPHEHRRESISSRPLWHDACVRCTCAPVTSLPGEHHPSCQGACTRPNAKFGSATTPIQRGICRIANLHAHKKQAAIRLDGCPLSSVRDVIALRVAALSVHRRLSEVAGCNCLLARLLCSCRRCFGRTASNPTQLSAGTCRAGRRARP